MEKEKEINQFINAEELFQKKLLAVELLANGKTDLEAARMAGVSRQTVNEWKNHDAEFKAQLQIKRREVVFGIRDKMNELVMSSMEIVKKGLETKNQKERLALALQILKLATRLGVGKEETDAEFRQKDRKFTLMVLTEAIRNNPMMEKYKDDMIEDPWIDGNMK